MTLISHRYNFIYIKARKVAGTSTEGVLEKFCLPPEEESWEVVENKPQIKTSYGIIGCRGKNCKKGPGYWTGHLSPNQIKNKLGKNTYDSYVKICNVRNPFDMIVSIYHHKIEKKGISFNDWIKKASPINWNKHFWGVNQDFPYRYIRYENLSEDLKEICSDLGINLNEVDLPNWKRTYREKNYREYYTKKTKNLVEKSYEKVLNYFGYSF